MSQHTNLATSIIASFTDNGDGSVDFTMVNNDYLIFPSSDFYVTANEDGTVATMNNAEILYVVSRSGNTFTALRAQLGSSQKAIQIEWRVSNSLYAEELEDYRDKTFIQAFTGQSYLLLEHNMAKFPSVTIVDTAGDGVVGAVDYVDINNIEITLSDSTSGKVSLN